MEPGTENLNDTAAPARTPVIGRLVRLVSGKRAPDLEKLAEALLSEKGESSAVALARQILDCYGKATSQQRAVFLAALAERFGASEVQLERAIAQYRADPTPRNQAALHAAAEPRRQELIRRLNLAPGATELLVRMREDVLRELGAHPALQALDADFLHLFSSWFNRGFLVLRRIDWETSALILEKIIRYEAVHEISSWEELRRRIDPRDRRCFAFFHPTLPDEPLIFVEVALTGTMPEAIGALLASERKSIDPRRAGTAVFYSISNCQPGLRGVPLGNFLIKQVVEELKREFPGLKQFVTLSPVPGFANWLRREREATRDGFLTDEDKAVLRALDTPGWCEAPRIARSLRPVLLAAVAEYFLRARDRAGRVIDPVARFHLNNGARLERINWCGDTSTKGLVQAAGFMVNYLYELDDIERNHEVFVRDNLVVASRPVRRHLRDAPR